MAIDQKIGVLWKLLFGTVTCLSFALPALSNLSKLTKTSCPDDYKCKMVRLPDGTMLQTVPKLFSPHSVVAGKFPGEHLICRIPESTELSTTDATTKPTTNPTTTISDTTTSQETTISTYSPLKYEYGGSFYNFSTSEMDHASAVSSCSQYGSHLVFIESQEEEDFIVVRVQLLSDARKDYWIGLTGSSLSEAKWLDGSSLTYSNFNSDSFNDNGNCFRIVLHDQIRWHDSGCSVRFRYICEKEVGI